MWRSQTIVADTGLNFGLKEVFRSRWRRWMMRFVVVVFFVVVVVVFAPGKRSLVQLPCSSRSHLFAARSLRAFFAIKSQSSTVQCVFDRFGFSFALKNYQVPTTLLHLPSSSISHSSSGDSHFGCFSCLMMVSRCAFCKISFTHSHNYKHKMSWECAHSFNREEWRHDTVRRFFFLSILVQVCDSVLCLSLVSSFRASTQATNYETMLFEASICFRITIFAFVCRLHFARFLHKLCLFYFLCLLPSCAYIVCSVPFPNCICYSVSVAPLAVRFYAFLCSTSVSLVFLDLAAVTVLFRHALSFSLLFAVAAAAPWHFFFLHSFCLSLSLLSFSSICRSGKFVSFKWNYKLHYTFWQQQFLLSFSPLSSIRTVVFFLFV